MGGFFEIAGALFNTPEKKEIVLTSVNVVCAIASYNTFRHSQALSGEFFASMFGLFTIAYEIFRPHSNDKLLAVADAANAGLSYFALNAPISALAYSFNGAARGLNMVQEEAEAYRSERTGFFLNHDDMTQNDGPKKSVEVEEYTPIKFLN